MPVVKVPGGFKIRSSDGKLVGTRRGGKDGQPFLTKAEAERVSGIRESFLRRRRQREG